MSRRRGPGGLLSVVGGMAACVGLGVGGFDEGGQGGDVGLAGLLMAADVEERGGDRLADVGLARARMLERRRSGPRVAAWRA